MKKMLSSFLLIVMVAGLCSCASLKSKYYPGKVAVEKGLIGKKMLCIFGDAAFNVNVLSCDDIVMARLEWDDQKKEFKAVNNKAVLSELGKGYLFLNILGDDGLYTILKCTPREKWIVVYTIKEEKIKKDIESGRIKATVNDKDSKYVLDLSKEELDKYLEENVDTLFDYNNPMVVNIEEISK